MKIVFFGASKFVIPLIEMLNSNFDLALVVTTESDQNDTVPSFCKKNNIPCLSIKSISNALEEIESKNAELGVLAYFGLLLPKELLNAFPKGILNIHPSLLPKYRGATPVQTAILNGDAETGVTIIKLDEELDHGSILAQVKEKINPDDSLASLHDRLFTKGTEMLKEIIPQYLNDKIKLQDQKHEDATLTERNLTRESGFVDFENPPDKQKLDRMIKAYYPWPGVWTNLKIKDKEIRIKFLPENKLQVEGKKPVSIKDFINGYPELKEKIGKIMQ